MKLYQEIASKLIAIENCKRWGNGEWECKHSEKLEKIIKDGPWGSGIDEGVELDHCRSNVDRLVFTTAFHHMNENGCYDGWTNHEVIVKACLFNGVSIRITGRNRNDIKGYLADLFHSWLTEDVDLASAVAA
jgi:hypothetical protein